MQIDELKAAFKTVFGAGAPVVCRAPGRVNIIGEHTDYNGLPVLPMTIGADVRIAFAKTDDATVRVRSVGDTFPAAEFINKSAIPASSSGAWENYCKAAIVGLNTFFGVKKYPGMNMLITGTIPVAAGLSSSSALVVATALAYLACLDKHLGKDITRLTLAGILAEAEQYVGTRGGGMDQAIILLGEKGNACKIDFYPLRTEWVSLIPGYSFVVCHSLVKAEKTGDALHLYNEGPRTAKVACALVERQVQDEFDDDIRVERLGELWHGHLCMTHAEIRDLFARTFPAETIRLSEIGKRLRLTETEIRKRWLGDLKEPDEGFRLKARVRHQLTESKRVELARDMLLIDDAAGLGRLMNESHQSCAEDYRISCPELDTLVAIAREAGALGARLTGAGFGGSTVNLVANDRVDEFIASVEKKYYKEYLSKRKKTRKLETVASPVFIAHATAGAGYLKD